VHERPALLQKRRRIGARQARLGIEALLDTEAQGVAVDDCARVVRDSVDAVGACREQCDIVMPRKFECSVQRELLIATAASRTRVHVA